MRLHRYDRGSHNYIVVLQRQGQLRSGSVYNLGCQQFGVLIRGRVYNRGGRDELLIRDVNVHGLLWWKINNEINALCKDI